MALNQYDMERQLRQGETAERFLDSYFRDEFDIRPVSREQQRQGIDRIFTRRKDGQELKIEYKADKRAAQTGNAFVETISVDTTGKQGWAFTCQADFLLYYVVGVGPLYILRPGDIKKRVAQWQRKYPARHIPNDGYHTVGLLVPLDEFERIAVQVLSL